MQLLKNTYSVYPFGMEMPGRSFVGGDYRYGFNGIEMDDEIKNVKGSSYDFGARMYDPRVGRWLTIDPLAGKYPSTSPYVYTLNNPIIFIDPNGEEVVLPNSDDGKRLTVKGVQRYLRAQLKEVGSGWRPKLVPSESGKTIEFANKIGRLRAKIYAKRNFESDDPKKRELATVFNSLTSEESSSQIVMPFNQMNYDAMTDGVEPGPKSGINARYEKAIAEEIGEQARTMNPAPDVIPKKKKDDPHKIPPPEDHSSNELEATKNEQGPDRVSKTTGAEVDHKGDRRKTREEKKAARKEKRLE